MIENFKFMRINLKYILFYTFLCLYFIFGSYTIYVFINEYSLLQKEPKSISTLYITPNKTIFLKSILFSIILNLGLALYLVKNYTKKFLLKFLSIFFFISVFLIFLKKLDLGEFVLLNEAFIVPCSILFIVFSSKIAIQSFSIFAFWLIIFFHLKENSTSLTTSKKIITFFYFIISFVIYPFFFPNYWLGAPAIQ